MGAVQSLVKRTTYNFSSHGNSIRMGYFFTPGNAGEKVLNYTNQSINYYSITPVAPVLWLQNEKLSFPYTGFSIIISNISLTVNGTFLKNVPNFDPHNVLKCLGEQFQLWNSIYYLSYSVDISASPIASLNASNYINQGTYMFNFNFTFIPIFDIGPYHIGGSPQHMDFRWVQTYVT